MSSKSERRWKGVSILILIVLVVLISVLIKQS
ncbi:Uncharacterised protein [Serratia liquefaciens]|nr:Uncharacterised protein [Serratia liquefaciens]